MKTRWILAILLIAAISVSGCSKKEPTPPAGDESPAQDTGGMVETAKETASKMVAEFTKDVDLEKTVEQLKTEAAKMSVDDLRAVAVKYKEAIEKKQVDLNAVMKKLQDIPMTEKLGTEAQELTTEMKELTETLKPLTDRLAVYVDAIKAQGGDTADLKVG
ncbi:MAG: hypothetical protein ACYTER_06180 [Planctomycetota bacterium]|jgi:formiminotetrahydrofolate cyclodeaminase